MAAYRAGYLPEERRELEQDLSSGRLLGIAATNALELGIDVGGLDAVVLNGFPGTLASMWQQAGRAGRTGRRSAAVLVAGDDQLDQWYAAHPEELTHRSPERAVVNPENPFVLRAQVACAAHELPLTPDDERWFGDGLDDAVRDLVHADLLKPRGGKMYWAGNATAGTRRRAARPARRSSTGSSTATRSAPSAPSTTRACSRSRIPARCTSTRAGSTASTRLDLRDHVAVLHEYDDDDEYTQPRTETDIAIVDEERLRAARRTRSCTSARSRCATRWSRTSASRSRRTP